MAKPPTELRALKNLISEAELILSTTTLPENRSKRALELLRAARALTDDLIGQAKLTPAAVLGHKGGNVMAQRGSEYFRKLAAKRKTRAGGRPRKNLESGSN
jgi:hypothetical protein